jgi:serine/threonine-protein kinase
MEDLTGRQLGQYRVVGPIGEGGMAAVYRAYEPGLDRYVALKILPRHFTSDPQFIGRFQQEAKLIAKLQHVHILPVYDFGQEDDYTFIVMPFVQTGTLADMLDDHPLHLPDILRIVAQVGDALAYAHERGIVHRDVKPSNILIDDRGNCLLTDFGIAKIVEATVQFTQTGAIIGTPAYMSPEQILGEALDGRSDLYSLGIILFEMATGRQPYRAETPPAIFVKHLHDPLPMPRELNPGLPEAVERVILKALAKDREHRFPTASAMIQALSDATHEGKAGPVQPPAGEADLAPTIAAEATDHAAARPTESEVAEPARHLEPERAAGRRPTVGRWGWALAGIGGLVGIGAVAGVGLLVFNALGRQEPGAEPTPSPATQNLPAATIAPAPSPSPAPPRTPTPAAGTSIEAPADGMRLLYVPAGEFLMGAGLADPDASDREKPVHTVFLDAYWIDQTEVTNRMYRMCVNVGSCMAPQRVLEFDDPDLIDYPVVWVDWQAAAAYCAWAGRRLPTEAEWEKAARGADERAFPWGSFAIAGHLLNFADRNLDEDWADPAVDDGHEYSAPIGSYPAGASPYGALDMAGNVWEWVSDWFDPAYYLDSPRDNPVGPPSSPAGQHSVRGGSFLSNARNVRVAYRYGYSPTTAAADLGFRCSVSEAVAP